MVTTKAPPHQHEEFFVLVPVRRMRLRAGRQRGFVYLYVVPGMSKSIENGPRLVGAVLLYRQLVIRLDKMTPSTGPSAANAGVAARRGSACSKLRRVGSIKVLRTAVSFTP